MKILLISFYCQPLNSIASQRAYSLGQQLGKNNEVHLVTRSWTGAENTWEDLLKSNTDQKLKKDKNITVHYLPFTAKSYLKTTILRKSQTLLNFILGKFNTEVNTLQFLTYCQELLRYNRFDYLYVTSPPLNIIELGSKLSKQFNVPLIADFRDLQNHLILKKKLKYSIKEKLELNITNKFLKKNLKNAFLISTASEPITDYLKSIGLSPAITVLNGYELDLFKNLKTSKSSFFEISLIGTVYPEQNISLFIEAFRELESYKDIRINFVGVGAILEVANKINNQLKNARVTNKLPRIEALEIGKSSNILFYMGWKGYKGIYSGKIFEYLGLRKNIIIAPCDNDVIDSLLKKTKSGISVNTKEEIISYILEKYNQWENKANINYEGIKINEYSREHQNKKIIRVIENIT